MPKHHIQLSIELFAVLCHRAQAKGLNVTEYAAHILILGLDAENSLTTQLHKNAELINESQAPPQTPKPKIWAHPYFE